MSLTRTREVKHGDYTIKACNLGRHGYSAVAVRDGYSKIDGNPPDMYCTSKAGLEFTGPGAKQKAIQAARDLIDAGPPSVLIWTVMDRLTSEPIGKVQAPTRGVAESMARHEWGSLPGVNLEVSREPESLPWDWNDGCLFCGASRR